MHRGKVLPHEILRRDVAETSLDLLDPVLLEVVFGGAGILVEDAEFAGKLDLGELEGLVDTLGLV